MKILRTDKEQLLLRLFDRGDASAMDKLYVEYADYLTGVAYRYLGNDDDVKDVLQEAFIKIFTQIGSFKYRGKGSLKAWLTRIVINESLMFLRTSAKNSPAPYNKRGDFVSLADEAALEEFDTATYSPPSEGTGEVSWEVLFDFIASLPSGYRTVFNLFAIDGLSHKQIAAELGITPSTSASQYHKARAMLAKMINEYRKTNGHGEQMD